MNELAGIIEAILFLTARPVSLHTLAKISEVNEADVKKALDVLIEMRNTETSGIHVVVAENAVELSTNPAFASIVSSMSKEETEGELTRPQLETLTIIAYRGPVTKAEIEYIRGVNCSIILRNLLMRGLVVEKESKTHLQSEYSMSTEMLRHVGVSHVSELPDYEILHANAKISKMLEEL